MKLPAIGLLLVFALNSSVNGGQWVCPLIEYFDLGNGYSEYYCEECTGNYGLHLFPTGTPSGDCRDPAKTNCREISDLDAKSWSTKEVRKNGMPAYLSGTPKVKNNARILSQGWIRIENRRFRLFLISSNKGRNSLRIAGVGYEIAPNQQHSLEQVIKPSLVKWTSKHTAMVTIGSVRYRIITKKRSKN